MNTVHNLNTISVQILNNLKMRDFDNETDNFNVLRKLDKEPSITQRELSSKLGISLGKINYCLKELRKKGLIKISNFKKNKNKIN